MKAEFNSAGRTDLEVYVPYVPKSGPRGECFPREDKMRLLARGIVLEDRF